MRRNTASEFIKLGHEVMILELKETVGRMR